MKVMDMRKAKIKIKNAGGFTLVELLVVLVIMVLLLTTALVNLAGTRAARDLKIAQNELVSNIRKAESYTLSARVLSNGQVPQYYFIRFDLSKPSKYVILAVYNVGISPQLAEVETVTLPSSVKISSILISNRTAAPLSQSVSDCALVGFRAPYNKVIFNSGCNPSSPGYPYTLLSNDDYQKIVGFQTNVQCTNLVSPPPISCTASTDSLMTITLTSKANSALSNQIVVNGITGAVTVP